MWRLWSLALGRKEGRNDREADNIALLRTVILLSYLITNCFIIAGVIRQWNAHLRTTNQNFSSPPCNSYQHEMRHSFNNNAM